MTTGSGLEARSALFRPEALEHAGSRRHGEVILYRPISYSFLTALFASFVVLLVLFFCLFSYARKAHVTGEVMPASGLLRVPSSSGGVVSRLLVKEGASVKTGDVLAVVTNERSSEGASSADAAIAAVLRERRASLADDQARSREQMRLRREAVARRISGLRDDVARAQQQIELQGRRAALAEQALRQTEDLQASNFVSAAQVRDKQADVIDQQTKLGDLRRSKGTSERDLATAEGELKDLAVQGSRDEEAARRGLGATDQDMAEHEARRTAVIVAPNDGTIAAVNARMGQSVGAGQALFSMVPAGSPMEVELYVPSKEAGFLKKGMKAQLRYSAFSYQKYGQFQGVIQEISGNAMRREELSLAGGTLEGVNTTDGLYRIRVALDRQVVSVNGQDEALKPGMTVDASVVLEERKLYEWVVEPLYAMKGRF